MEEVTNPPNPMLTISSCPLACFTRWLSLASSLAGHHGDHGHYGHHDHHGHNGLHGHHDHLGLFTRWLASISSPVGTHLMALHLLPHKWMEVQELQIQLDKSWDSKPQPNSIIRAVKGAGQREPALLDLEQGGRRGVATRIEMVGRLFRNVTRKEMDGFLSLQAACTPMGITQLRTFGLPMEATFLWWYFIPVQNTSSFLTKKSWACHVE